MDTSASSRAEVVFRDAQESDVPVLVALVDSAYRGDRSRLGWTTEADFLHGQRTDHEAVSAVVADPHSRLLLAEHHGDIVACCQVEHRGDHAHFGMFAVRPELQGAGLGKAVIAEAERVARDSWGIREIHMTVISIRDELIAWYVRRGYARTGKTSPFPYGNSRFGVPQRPDLKFELLVKSLP
jgi:ribosomal protein S18 acetylase RimI-like enzyme